MTLQFSRGANFPTPPGKENTRSCQPTMGIPLAAAIRSATMALLLTSSSVTRERRIDALTPPSFSISYRNANRFVTELHVYKGGVDELRTAGQNRAAGSLYAVKKKKKKKSGRSGHGVSDRICVSLWRGRECVAKRRMSSVCKGRVSAFCGSLYQQRICW